MKGGERWNRKHTKRRKMGEQQKSSSSFALPRFHFNRNLSFNCILFSLYQIKSHKHSKILSWWKSREGVRATKEEREKKNEHPNDRQEEKEDDSFISLSLSISLSFSLFLSLSLSLYLFHLGCQVKDARVCSSHKSIALFVIFGEHLSFSLLWSLFLHPLSLSLSLSLCLRFSCIILFATTHVPVFSSEQNQRAELKWQGDDENQRTRVFDGKVITPRSDVGSLLFILQNATKGIRFCENRMRHKVKW